MKKTFTFFEILLLMCGVFYAETEEVKTVMEGDSVTLNPVLTQIQGIIQILWRFGEPGLTIARFKNGISYDEKFKDRLQLNKTTGFLTIRNMRTNHSGLYKVQVDHDTGTSDQKFSVTVYESPSVIAGTEAELKSVSVKEGDPVTLHVPQIQGDELIVWRFGDEGKLIAKADIETKSSSLYDKTDERFRDRLKLDQTGSLTITNTRTTDSGEYKVKISSNKQTSYKRFIVTVTVPVPDSGLSGGEVTGIVIGVLLAAAVAGVAGVIYFYRRPITTKLPSQTWSVPEGDYITLNPEPEIQRGDEIQWLFGDKDTLIAEIKGENREMKTHDGPDERFMNRLKLGEKTGSLTITNIFTKQSGLYTLKIRRGRETFYKRFNVSVSERTITVTEGKSFTLKPDIEINKDETILWMFEDEELYCIAEFIGEIDKFLPRDYTPGRRFRDRLELNKTTGSLTIKNTRTTDAGHYMLQVFSNTEFSQQTFTVTVDDESEKKFVDGGDSVTLKPDTEIQRDDQILWMFGDLDKLIAQIRGGTVETYDDVNERFRGRLKLDETGSLTITKIEAKHTGLYKLQIIRSRGEILVKRFKVLLDLRYVLVGKGETVYFDSGLNEIQRDDEIEWRFGDENSLIAEIKGGTGKTHDGPDKIFRGRLKLNKKTGDLIINDSTYKHTGEYKVTIRSSEGLRNRTHVFTVRGSKFLIEKKREKSLMKAKIDSRRNRVNESVTVVNPLLNGDDLDVVNEEEGTSSL